MIHELTRPIKPNLGERPAHGGGTPSLVLLFLLYFIFWIIMQLDIIYLSCFVLILAIGCLTG